MVFLNKKIFNDSADIFGLDLSDLSVKIVKFEDYGDFQKVSSYVSVSLPVGCVIEGEIKNKDQVVATIKKAMATAGPQKIKTKKVICSLPENKAFLRIVAIPQMNESEMSEAVKWEMEANIPLPLEQVYYDWQAIPDSVLFEKNKINLLVAAVAKISVDQTLEVLELAGLEPVGLEIESIAQARSLLAEKNEQLTSLVVDIGDRRTSFLVAKGAFPCFTSSIPLCGKILTDVISKGMKISFEEAEKIKLAHGIGDDFKNDSLFKLEQPVLENLAQEIERSIDFYLSELKYSKSVDKIILCGGGANTKGILPYLSKKLGREIELGNPWANVKWGKNLPVIDRNQSVQYSTAVGLALRALYYEDLY